MVRITYMLCVLLMVRGSLGRSQIQEPDVTGSLVQKADVTGSLIQEYDVTRSLIQEPDVTGSLIQKYDVTGAARTSPGTSAVDYYVTGRMDHERHWTEEVKVEQNDENRHIEVDHMTIEQSHGKPMKVNITDTFSDKPASQASDSRRVDEVKNWVFQLYPKSHRDWFGAEAECQEWGGHLAIPDTKEKMSQLTRILQAHNHQIGETTAAFLGFSDIEAEGHFVTVLGNPLFDASHSAWSPPWFASGQPDDDKSWSKDGEDCGSLWSSGGLNDVPCRYSFPFICEKLQGIEEAVVEKETTTPAQIGDEDNGTLQLFPLSSTNWYGARKACVEWGGFLAIPDSEEKVMKMTKILNSPTMNPDKLGAFLGFNDIKEEGKFVTIFGKSLFNPKADWSPQWSTSTLPDDDKNWSSDGEDCGALRPNGGLDDVPCRYELPYFCEKNGQVVVPEVTTGGACSGDCGHQEGRGDVILRLFARRDQDWFEARDACRVWGGSLAVPNTRKKVEAMSLKMKAAKVHAAFLGFGDQEEEGHFVTVSGAPVFNPSSWSPSWFRSDQPDDDKGWFREGEDCGSIRSGGGLNDVPCKHRMPYFCEKTVPAELTEEDALSSETSSRQSQEYDDEDSDEHSLDG